MTDAPHYRWLHEVLANGKTVIASSRRLARELKAEFDSAQIAKGLGAWPSAEIHFWQDWLRHIAEEQTEGTDRRLIDAGASVLLWEQCLERFSQAELLSKTSLVRQARRAWQRMHEWQVPVEVLAEFARSRDERWFADAAASYQQKLDAGRWLDVAQLPAYCMEIANRGVVGWPEKIVYAGFDRPTPAITALFDALRRKGRDVLSAPEAKAHEESSYRSFADAAQMWRAAGHWAREQLQIDPQAKIAIVVPDLETDATGVAREVREGFAPGWQLAGGRYRASVDVSYGMPLANYPAIQIARLCLHFAATGLNSADVSILLRSSLLGETDIAERSKLDLALRALPDRQWIPQTLLAALQSDSRNELGQVLQDRLQTLAQLHEQRATSRSPTDWAQAIDELLSSIGWPGNASPDSAEFQLHNRWRQLLNELARLGSVSKEMTLAECVRRLFQVAGEAVYQPELQQGGLQLLGMLEAVGLEFDQLWLGGMDASRWPAAGGPVALINRQLQREHEMPDATPADTLQFSQRILQRLLASTRRIEVCWARIEGDKELIKSPLLSSALQDVLVDSAEPQRLAVSLLGQSSEAIPFDKAPAVDHDEMISGGAYTVQAMREEPFRAFAKGRLHVKELDIIQPGLTARMRGTILHDALHGLLRDLPDQAAIKSWDSDARRQRIEKAAWRPLAKFWQHADPVLQKLVQLEKRRVEQLLTDFLVSECEREEFEIAGVECKASLKYGPVLLKLRIDRLDRLGDGALLITDYKASEKQAFLEAKTQSPKQLQLCVYARALEDDSIGGLQLTYINSREIKYVGDGGSVALGKSSVDNWSAVLEAWCAEVDVLLKRFADGEVGVNLVQETKKSRPLAVLSRVAELPHAG